MTAYTVSEARQKFASVLEKARAEVKVLIKRKDGSVFEIKPIVENESPLNVEGVDLELSAEEIVSSVREVRER